eukprot:73248-Chlamydomonas_euryale.AAC.1
MNENTFSFLKKQGGKGFLNLPVLNNIKQHKNAQVTSASDLCALVCRWKPVRGGAQAILRQAAPWWRAGGSHACLERSAGALRHLGLKSVRGG